MQRIIVLVLGAIFGTILVKSEVVSWFRIQDMFRFESAYMYLVIGSAVAVGAISVALIKLLKPKTIAGEDVVIVAKAYDKGIVIGGLIFGMGWAITGACPGPIYAQIGSGAYLALVTFVSALIGVFLYGLARPYLPR
jgi:uncharacterized membrane protein YedE/YeeE